MNIEAECCLDQKIKKKHIILLGTLEISSNFLLILLIILILQEIKL